jgi:methionyl-tRNA formyltransferase
VFSSVFFGTPQFAVPALRALAAITEVRLVVTQPDRPAGRGRKPEASAVALAAAGLGLETIKPERVAGREFAARIRELGPDLLVTAAYGKLLGRGLRGAARLECLNVHASLLPAYRGAAPVARAILDGARTAGVSIMRMEAELDAGPVFLRAAVAVGPEESAGELTLRLAEVGSAALTRVIADLPGAAPEAQDHSLATWAPALRKEEGLVDWSREADALHAHVRGMHPWPCAFTVLRGEVLKIHRGAVAEEAGVFGAPGTVLAHTAAGVEVACGRGVLRLSELQLPGRKRLDPEAFFAGRRLEPGLVLGR